MTPPHVAAGINLAFWPFGAIARRGGAFFIRRSLRGDPVYTATLRAYVKQLLRDRFPQEFYLEGGRSRSGKLLFPKRLIELWVAQSADYPAAATHLASPPPVIAGSHDLLLDWSVRESGCELAILVGGSTAGMHRLLAGQAVACGLHLVDPASGEYDPAVLTASLPGLDFAVIEWAKRQQGLVLAPGNPAKIGSVAKTVAAIAAVAFVALAIDRVGPQPDADVPASIQTDAGEFSLRHGTGFAAGSARSTMQPRIFVAPTSMPTALPSDDCGPCAGVEPRAAVAPLRAAPKVGVECGGGT